VICTLVVHIVLWLAAPMSFARAPPSGLKSGSFDSHEPLRRCHHGVSAKSGGKVGSKKATFSQISIRRPNIPRKECRLLDLADRTSLPALFLSLVEFYYWQKLQSRPSDAGSKPVAYVFWQAMDAVAWLEQVL